MKMVLKKLENKQELFLWGVLLLGLLLRLQQWGRFIVADEDTIFSWISQLSKEPFPIHFYPPLFQYINYGLSLVYGPILTFLGIIPGSGELWTSDVGQAIVMGAGRLVSTVFGLLQIYWIILIGKRFFTLRIGLIAALIAAVNPLLILDGHILKVDLLLAFLFTVQLYLILLYQEKKDGRTLFWLGLVTGLAIAAKFQAAVEIPALIFVLVLINWNHGLWAILKNLLRLAAWIVVGFFFGAPNWLIHLFGNVKAAFVYVNEVFFSFELYDKGSLSYPLYLKDFVASFGPVVMLGVLGSLCFLIFRFRRTDLLVWVTIASYIGILGYSGFYAHRMGLPLYSALSLLAAKFFIEFVIDEFGRRKYHRAWKQIVWSLFFVAVLAYAGTQGVYSIKRFNLWRTATTLDRAIEFRDRHFALGTPFIRENFSPVRPGDKGIWDLIGVETEVFRGENAMPFASSGLLTDYLLNGQGDADKRHELRHRLEEYLPFHRVQKRRFSEWDGDITFWYHTALAKIEPIPAIKLVNLPRSYALHRLQDTMAYPAGAYEKAPGLLKTSVVTNCFADWRMVYSHKDIKAFKGMIFADDIPQQVTIEVNDQRIVLNNCIGGVPFELPGLSAQALHHDWVYRISIRSEQSEVWTVFDPLYQDDALNRIDSLVVFADLSDIRGDLNFSDYSQNEVMIYKRTGIDPRLYTYLQRTYIDHSIEEPRVFLKKGCYRLLARFQGGSEGGEQAFAGIVRIISDDQEKCLEWSLKSNHDVFPLEINSEYAMTVWKIKSAQVKDGSLWLEPDVAKHINRSFGSGK